MRKATLKLSVYLNFTQKCEFFFLRKLGCLPFAKTWKRKAFLKNQNDFDLKLPSTARRQVPVIAYWIHRQTSRVRHISQLKCSLPFSNSFSNSPVPLCFQQVLGFIILLCISTFCIVDVLTGKQKVTCQFSSGKKSKWRKGQKQSFPASMTAE